MDIYRSIAALEAVLFASGEPMSLERLSRAVGIDIGTTEKLLGQLGSSLEDRGSGLRLLYLGGEYQLATREEFAEEIKNALDITRNMPLSQAALEVLAIVAYNQPVTRSYIEQVRGVDSSSVINTLIQKGLLEEGSRLDLPGRPLSYMTTPSFLRAFSLQTLEDLPPLPAAQEDENTESEEESI